MTSTLYRNGLVHSSADPFAEALLVDDGVVAWIGAEDTAAGLAARADRVIDLDGALVAPGFVDAHVHTLETGLALESVDLSPAGARTRAAALDAVAAGARRLDAADPDGDEVLLAFGWDETAWPERTPLTREDLDAAAGGRPVYAAHADMHHAVVSTALAASAGLDRLPGWSAAGLVIGEALRVARDVAQELPPARRVRAYRVALQRAAELGIVSVHEMSAAHTDTREGLRELVALSEQEPLPQVVAYRGELVESPDDVRELLAQLPFLAGIGGDVNVDGSIAARTAALRQPYTDHRPLPGSALTGDHGDGLAYLSAEEIGAHLAACSAVGVQGGFHVVGDRAMDLLVLGLEIAASEDRGGHGPGPLRAARHRVEHALFVDASALASLLLYGVSLSIQPAWASTWGGVDGLWAQRLGVARAGNMSPFADLAGAGIPLAFGSDAPVTALDPWQAIRAAVSHEDAEQRLSGRAAFRAHTRGGWRLAGLDGTGAGELTVGAPAHLAVWRADSYGVLSSGRGLTSWSAEARAGQPVLPDLHLDAREPECLQTVRAGVPIYDTFA
ncbi:Amidohydrolase 3 [Xylanimonas cellulosilytica DSM 15894]|uniref:Amidohydrolase 3 n=1 Tax=Xylanimonas cellulosilytica (strain DSM 15894 / JCM 12276 / CECT 5975 / KCTC 9989 / LMG 20990 / NBRC 107835 / XIL07) TaxID=446471 RepID=D1BSV4_XYLCX|nr:amidohydrolase family protein [Xylanimonas cellulosilytica]ACZ30796.1 Amidohydrolase 3 [Xylanimonas cellulosilytica DSM 15894]